MKLSLLLCIISSVCFSQIRVCWDPVPISIVLPNSDGMLLNWSTTTGYIDDQHWIVSEEGRHQIEVEVTDPETGCSTMRSKSIVAACDTCTFFAPNAFTPGNGIINNSFMPIGLNIQIQGLSIWDRWGQIIYQGTSPWFGTNKNKDDCPMDVYNWTCDYLCSGKQMKALGRVTIVR